MCTVASHKLVPIALAGMHLIRFNCVQRRFVPLMSFLASTVLSGCSPYLTLTQSPAHLPEQPPAKSKPVVANTIPEPIRALPPLPAPKAAAKTPTYSVVVNEVPVKELLFALARDTKMNIDIHPGIQGIVTINAINETLPAILDRVSRQVNLRYTVDGNTISVVPDSPYLVTYKVNYVNVSRNTTSTIGVASQIATTGSSGGTPGGAAGGGSSTGAAGNSSNTTVSSSSVNNFWDVLAENVRAILRSTRAVSQNIEDRAARAEAVKAARDERLQQAEAVSRAGAAAPNLFSTVFGNTPAPAAIDKDEVIVNPVAGTVGVVGTQQQQRLVEQFLNRVSQSAQRQVLIEATIVEVALNKGFQAGIDWSRIAEGAGFSFTQSLLGSNLSSPPNFSIQYVNSKSSPTVTALLRALESFGTTRVLSSPKLMAINNQTALLKVVENRVYFSVESERATITSNGLLIQPTYTTTAHTLPVGVVMHVTPQINDNGSVSMTVRPTVSRILDFVDDPNPGLGSGANRIKNAVPEIQVSEMESVLQVTSGQTVILGGLMQDSARRTRDGLPLVSDIPGVGDAFAYRDESGKTTELVIFLRPTVITNPSLESDELNFYRRYLPSAQATMP